MPSAVSSRSCSRVGASPALADDQAAPLYRPNRVDVIYLTLSPVEQAKLEAASDQYVKGTFSLAETGGTLATAAAPSTPQNVEIKLKGDASFRTLAGKAAFKLKFAKKEPAFLGLRKMTLNNMVEDPSMTHETLAYAAFRAAGVPAPRTSFAYVYLNGVDYGLHLDLETLDKVALEKHFGPFAEPQHLYEGENGVDVLPGSAGAYEVDEGDEANRGDLEALIAAANSGGATPWSTQVAPYADLGEMSRMWAVEKYVGQYDGYASGKSPFQPNNYYLYSDASGRFQMLPWGTDETWQQKNHLAFDAGHGLLFAHCLDDAACAATYRQSLADSCGAIEGAGLGSLAESTAALLAPWQQLEQGNGGRHEHSLGEIGEGVAETKSFVASRPAEAAAFLGGPCASVAPPPLPPAPTDRRSVGTGTAPVPEVRGFEVVRTRAEGTLLKTDVHLPAAGALVQRVAISTAQGKIGVGHVEARFPGGRDLTLELRLSRVLAARLKTRSVRIQVVTTFRPSTGPSESVSRGKRLPRLDS